MIRLFLIVAALLIADSALAQTLPKRPPNPIGDVIERAKERIEETTQLPSNPLGNALQKFGDVLGSDTADAVRTATSVSTAQDGNGQRCWAKLSRAATVFKANPLPKELDTPHLATFIEKVRVLSIVARQVCDDTACTQMFADGTNTLSRNMPIRVPLPSLTQLCADLPPIPVSAPDDAITKEFSATPQQ